LVKRADRKGERGGRIGEWATSAKQLEGYIDLLAGSVRFSVCGSISCFASNTLESCSNTVKWSWRDRL
jgi:hypothetical protein